MMPFHERVASSSCSLEPRFIDFAAKQIELLVGEPEDAFAVDDRVACVEGIAAFAGGEKLRLHELDRLFRIWIEMARNEIQRPARLVGIGQ